jgi:hypothetical protein
MSGKAKDILYLRVGKLVDKAQLTQVKGREWVWKIW